MGASLTQQRRVKETHNPEGCLHDGDSLVHLDIVHVSVPEPDGSFVIRCCLMVVVDAGAVVLFKLLIVLPGLQVLDGKLQTSRIIALGVDGLYGGVGDEGFGIVARFIILVDSHHLKVEVADLYVLAHQRTVVFVYIYNKDASFLFKERFFETTLK